MHFAWSPYFPNFQKIQRRYKQNTNTTSYYINIFDAIYIYLKKLQ